MIQLRARVRKCFALKNNNLVLKKALLLSLLPVRWLRPAPCCSASALLGSNSRDDTTGGEGRAVARRTLRRMLGSTLVQ
jgi:hypothetical protein